MVVVLWHFDPDDICHPPKRRVVQSDGFATRPRYLVRKMSGAATHVAWLDGQNVATEADANVEADAEAEVNADQTQERNVKRMARGPRARWLVD